MHPPPEDGKPRHHDGNHGSLRQANRLLCTATITKGATNIPSANRSVASSNPHHLASPAKTPRRMNAPTIQAEKENKAG